jgi:hypothetical protein
MQFKLLIAAGLMACSGWAGTAGAATVGGSGTVNDFGNLGIGSVVTVDSSGGGISAGTYPAPRSYFDYTFSFTLTAPAKVDGDIFSTGGNHFDDFHAVVSDVNPKDTVLYYDHDPDMYKHYDNATPPNEIPNDNPIDIGSATPFISAGSSNGDGVGVHLASLGAGTYYLRLFGVSQAGSVGAFSGDMTFSKVATTPVPPALLLFLTGIGGLGFAGWRRKQAALA